MSLKKILIFLEPREFLALEKNSHITPQEISKGFNKKTIRDVLKVVKQSLSLRVFSRNFCKECFECLL